MAGRGGRGRGGKGRGFTFDIGAIGFGRGEALPTTILQPPPLFPAQEKKPLPLRMSQADDYLLALKQEFRGCMQESPYYLKPDVATKDIERYSDRYKEKPDHEPTIEWEPDWRFFPSELKIKVRRRRSQQSGAIIPLTPASRNSQDNNTVQLLEALAAKEGSAQNQAGGEAGGDDSGEEDEEEYDEEEQEEANDYLVSHFDDDDEYGMADDDDMDEGPIY